MQSAQLRPPSKRKEVQKGFTEVVTSKLRPEGCEGKYRPREKIVICPRISKKFAKVFCHVTAPTRPLGRGEVEKEGREVSEDTDQMCVSESSVRGTWRTEQRASLVAGRPNSWSEETRGGPGLVFTFKDKTHITHLFFHSFCLFKSPVVPKIELV